MTWLCNSLTFQVLLMVEHAKRGLSTWVKGSLWLIIASTIYVAKITSYIWTLALKSIWRAFKWEKSMWEGQRVATCGFSQKVSDQNSYKLNPPVFLCVCWEHSALVLKTIDLMLCEQPSQKTATNGKLRNKGRAGNRAELSIWPFKLKKL